MSEVIDLEAHVRVLERIVENGHVLAGMSGQPPLPTEAAIDALLAERKQLYEQVSALQAGQTEQLKLARRCAFERAAQEVELTPGMGYMAHCVRKLGE